MSQKAGFCLAGNNFLIRDQNIFTRKGSDQVEVAASTDDVWKEAGWALMRTAESVLS
jgi:hypothetical protein